MSAPAVATNTKLKKKGKEVQQLNIPIIFSPSMLRSSHVSFTHKNVTDNVFMVNLPSGIFHNKLKALGKYGSSLTHFKVI